MLPRLLTLWHDLRSSLWALPLLMVAVAGAAAILAVHIPVREGDDPVWFLYSGSAQEAPQFLSNLVTAMITMATLVVSITMVVLTLAAQQLGPRLIRSFMADRRTQLTLGLFVSTVVYLLLVLRSAYGRTNLVPNLAVTGGTLLVLLCLIALLVFVHHLARSIIADNTIDRVGNALDDDIDRLLPESDLETPEPPATMPRENGAPFKLRHSGYIETVNYGGFVDIAKSANAMIELSFKPGRHAGGGGHGQYGRRARGMLAARRRTGIDPGSRDLDPPARRGGAPGAVSEHQRSVHRHGRDRPAHHLARQDHAARHASVRVDR